MGEVCLRSAQTASPSLFVRLRFACRAAGASPPAPPCAFASLGSGGRSPRLSGRRGLPAAVRLPAWVARAGWVPGWGCSPWFGCRLGLGAAVRFPGTRWCGSRFGLRAAEQLWAWVARRGPAP
ncbi:hypothetical protein EV646_101410 [Kribbella antiqua]|uniref:Uncharacterized protein n=1 Tax=Kribbella antiqua TaxID=2512217 RepID=A0A4R2J120_9ACTN|nr:hypothetical protein EV646_101410 [Kribbella antiqua]